MGVKALGFESSAYHSPEHTHYGEEGRDYTAKTEETKVVRTPEVASQTDLVGAQGYDGRVGANRRMCA